MEATTAALVGALAEYRDFADTLVQIRTSKGSAAAAAPLTAACAAAGTALLLRARELERGALLAAQGLKDASGEQRGRLDHDALALHNLVYEQQYYDKEIASCRAFRSAVAEEQIGSDAPPCGAKHDAELARLTAELQARKALKAQLASLEASRAAEQERRAAAQALVDDLRAHLTAVSATSKPLLDRSLPAGGSAVKDDREAAELLPLPLYIIYSQAATGASIVGLPLRVGVQGSVAAAQQEQQQQQQQQQGDGQQQQQGASAQDAKRRRKSAQQGDKTYKMHPLSVTLEVHQAGDGARQLVAALTFSYYSQLQLVGVAAGSSDDEALLTHLFLGDVGDGQLLEAVAACSSSGTLQFAEAGRPRPFRWAQELGGVDVLASLPSSLTGIGSDRSQVLSALASYRSKLRLETLLERLVAGKTGRRQLKRILEQLAKKEQPASSASARVVSKINTDITAWKHLGDVGMQQQAAPLFGQARLQAAWGQAGQAVSIAEEGEVAGEGGGGEEVSQLQHGDTAEEALLMGLLDDARPAQQESGGPDGAPAAPPGAAEVLLLEPGEAGYEEGEHLEEAVADIEAEGEPSAPDSELLLTGEGEGAPGGSGGDSASAGGRALLASHSLYRLVCRAGALEVHLHVMVFHSYPLCPPVFQVTKLLDLRTKDAPTPLADVNKVLALQQQVNDAAVKAAMAADAGEVLAVQILQLRQCIDLLSAQMRGAHSKDLVDNLRAKQHLQGRERQPRLVGC